jgi:hypothetical protein
VLINHRVFHGNFPNTGDRPREMLAIAYRPAWAGPQQPVAGWDPEDVRRLPDSVRPLFEVDKSIRIWDFGGGNKPSNMRSDAPGISPGRWGPAA